MALIAVSFVESDTLGVPSNRRKVAPVTAREIANPLVSVVLPIMNNHGTIRETLESILNQTFANIEIIIWDDNSDYDVLKEVGDLIIDKRIQIFRSEKRLGIPASWTQASKMASGDFVKLVCADDTISASLIEKQVRLLQKYGSEVGFVSCSRGVIGPRGLLLSRIPVEWEDEELITAQSHLRRLVRSGTTPFGEPMCVLFRKQVLRRIGYWETPFEFVADLSTYTRALLISHAVHSTEVLAFFRIRPGQHSKQRVQVLAQSHSGLYRWLYSELPDMVRHTDVLLAEATVVLRTVLKLGYRRIIGVDRYHPARAHLSSPHTGDPNTGKASRKST